MNKPLGIGLLMFLLTMVPLLGDQVVDLPQVTKPEGIAVGNDMLYILEGTTIHMYNLKGFEYRGKFGKAGEGPGEIKKNPYGGPLLVVPHRGKVYITSMGKLSVFSKTGEYIEEHRVNPFDSFYPIADRFICIGTQVVENKTLLAVFLADPDFNKGKPLYVSDIEVGQNFSFEFPFTPFTPAASEDRIFILAGKDGFAIDAFDLQGKKLYRIQKNEPALPIPASYQEETERSMKRNPNYAQLWDYFKQRISYKKAFPPVREHFVDDGRMYILTYKMKGNDRECIVLDLKGKELKRLWLPVPEQFGLDYTSYFTALRSVFYLLREDEDGETWKLHIRSLK